MKRMEIDMSDSEIIGALLQYDGEDTGDMCLAMA